MSDAGTWRARLKATREAGDVAQARYLIAQWWRNEPSVSAANHIRRYVQWVGEAAGLKSCRMAVVRSFTIEPLIPLFEVEALVAGVRLSIWLGEFNAYAQEMLDGHSELYRFSPDVTLCVLQGRDVVPALWNERPMLSRHQVDDETHDAIGRYRDLIDAFRSHCSTPLLIHNLDRPPLEGVLEAQSGGCVGGVIARIDAELPMVCAEYRDVHPLDYDQIVARHGRDRWFDPAKWEQVRLPISAGGFVPLVREWCRYLLPVLGMSAKVVVVDLDNTLWGGVVGEEGVEGLTLEPGHLELQRILRALRDMGVLLAVASKNNRVDAIKALDKLPGMLLRREDFSVLRIDWRPKVVGISEIVDELNVDLDAVVFIDDSEAERDQIRLYLPKVTVLDLPSRVDQYADAVRCTPRLGRLRVTNEDKARATMYRQRRDLEAARGQAPSLETFYRSLGQRLEVVPAVGAVIERCAQLTQKTNQFNLTSRRYSEEWVARCAEDAAWAVLPFRIVDRYGDNGVIGLALLRFEQLWAEIDTLLMSCRVIGRTVEHGMLHVIERVAAAHGARKIRGRYRPTDKNRQVESFFQEHDYAWVSCGEDGVVWEKELKNEAIWPIPEWIELVE